MVVPMILPAVIFLILKVNLYSAIVFALVAFFAILLAIFLINAVYILILRITTPEKFKNIISNIQIVFAIAIYTGYQIIPRMVDHGDMLNFEIPKDNWLLLLAPPYWFACAYNVLTTFHGDLKESIAAAMAFALPVASINLVVKYLAPSFNQKLAMISGGESAPDPALVSSPKEMKSAASGILNQVAALLTGTKAEQTGFMFAWKMIGRSRDFKIRVYPTIGYIMVLMILPYFNRKSEGRLDEHFLSGFAPLVSIYMFSLLLMIIMAQIVYSDKFKAAWIFFTTPVAKPGHVINGAIKAVMIVFYLPASVIYLILGVLLVGPSIIPNVLYALLNLLVIGYVMASLYANQLPFSQPRDESDKGGRFAKSLMAMTGCSILGVIHAFLFHNLIAIGIGFCMSLVALWLVQRSIKEISWEKLWVHD
jgi:hypothetical protein